MKLTPPVRINDSIELAVDALSSEGHGIGRVAGYAVFVEGALPGERVLCRITKAGSTYAEAKLVRILAPSDARVTPRCEHAGVCGGCGLQHMAYEAQLAAKRERVVSALERIGGIERPNVGEVVGMADAWRYRNKASFPACAGEFAVELGCFERNSNRVIGIDDCAIQCERSLEVLRAVRRWARECAIVAYDPVSGGGELRHVVTRTTSLGETAVVVVTAQELRQGEALVARLVADVPGVTSVVSNINRARSSVILGERFRTLYGAPYTHERILGSDFDVSAPSFLQVNHAQTEKLYAHAMSLLQPHGDELVYDAYCGIGTLSVALAKRVGRVVGIECVEAAVADARRNAKKNGAANAEFYCGLVEEKLPQLLAKGMLPDAIVLDPPRKGCERAAIEAIACSSARSIVYISCNPSTLARDCKHLRQAGYDIVCAQPFDMFPHTTHVESVILLSRAGR
ncbi:MAG: 23S rRNA (uracil(1939)-C(5))-methyltransferase RlmD [Clostridia bacterium]|nr:23S rRNA (uracil(1939)-C(5))-methyltransferase RlmD [Clostridia bacterium]